MHKKTDYKRVSVDEYFMKICDAAAMRSTCRIQLGCVIVRDKILVGMGYVGSLSGDKHCIEEGCLLVDNHGQYGIGQKQSCIRTIHAELNAIIKCTVRGNQEDGWLTSYSTYSPCIKCFQALLSIGVRTFVYRKAYVDVHRETYIDHLKHDIKSDICFKQFIDTIESSAYTNAQ